MPCNMEVRQCFFQREQSYKVLILSRFHCPSFLLRSKRSTCKDLPDTYQCKCLPGFAGTPGTDGEGCKFQASITTEDNGNLIVEVWLYEMWWLKKKVL